ncbi:unnamed protein product [Orchesella dallaii]|uniref:Uncharacterized protein n=1 Tax=Orchesella dallaii TaxID=48710 RepID=A0ABP1Q6L7_9HEXA
MFSSRSTFILSASAALSRNLTIHICKQDFKNFFSVGVKKASFKMAEKFTLTSPYDPIPPSPFKTVHEYLLDKVAAFTASGKSYYAIDAISKEKRYFNKFDEESKKIASVLYKKGVRKGDFVIYMPADMIKLHIFITGVWRANGVCRASYPDDDPATIESRIREGNCKVILCDSNRTDLCKEGMKNVEWPVEIITTTKCEGFLSVDDILESEDGTMFPENEVGGDDLALILCTSGTTGPPKGAVLTHGALVQHVEFIAHFPFTVSKPNLAFSVATHYSGTLFPLGILSSGNTTILTGKVSKELLWKSVSEMKPGLVFAFPTYLLTLVEPDSKGYNFDSIEIILAGGSLITPAIKRSLFQLPNLKDIINAYGMSESGILATNVIYKSDRKTLTITKEPHDFSCGTACPGTTIQFRNPETLEILGPNQKGELCAYNDFLFQSYLNNPEATKSSFIGKYVRTGDLGYFNEDGEIFVVDRLKEIFKYYNNHISPGEIENVISDHPLVKEVCVIGVSDPGGDVPRAFITLKECPTNINEIEEQVKEFANAKLPAYKHLKGGLYVVPDLPKGKSGKIVRQLVAQIAVK